MAKLTKVAVVVFDPIRNTWVGQAKASGRVRKVELRAARYFVIRYQEMKKIFQPIAEVHWHFLSRDHPEALGRSRLETKSMYLFYHCGDFCGDAISKSLR